MLRSIATISTFILLLSSSSFLAQDTLTIFMVEQFAADETQVTIPFSVTHFDTISYFQLSINWDSTRFSFNNVHDINLEGLQEENFAVNQAGSGKICMNWVDPISQATSITDSVVIFNITFDIISDNRDNSDIIFGNDPTECEAGDVNGNEIPFKTIGARIGFEQSTSINYSLPGEGISVDQNSPNPFTSETAIRFDIAQSEEVLFEVFDLEGRRVTKMKSQYPKGNNFIKLNKLQLNGSGVYQYSLTIKQKTISKKLILLD